MVFYQYSNPNNRKGSHPNIPEGQLVEFQQKEGKSGMVNCRFLPLFQSQQQEGKSLQQSMRPNCWVTTVGRQVWHPNNRKESHPNTPERPNCWVTTLGSGVCPNFGQGSPIPTRKLEICWSPTIFPNNGKGRCTGTLDFLKWNLQFSQSRQLILIEGSCHRESLWVT